MASNISNKDPLVGNWEFVKGENFEEFLKTQKNMNYVARKMAAKTKPTITIENKDKNWKIKMKLNKFMNLDFECEEDTEFPDKTPMGDTLLNILSRDGNKLVQQTKALDSATWENKITREVVHGQLMMTFQNGNVTSKRYFKRC